MKKKTLPFIIVGLQLLFLCSMIWFHSAKLSTATRVLLKTVPVDPKSIFRGYFANLNYEISSLPVGLLKDVMAGELKASQELFLVLKKDGEHWKAEGLYRNRPKGKVYIRGRLPSYYRFGSYQRKTLRLKYGIESFFLNEKDAKYVEDVNRGMDWRQREDLRKERISKLDPETRRIHKAGISEWSFKEWKKEFDAWEKEGLITGETKETLVKKYTEAFKKIAAANTWVDESSRKPITVEVAIDKNGYGYPTKLFCEGKEYR